MDTPTALDTLVRFTNAIVLVTGYKSTMLESALLVLKSDTPLLVKLTWLGQD